MAGIYLHIPFCKQACYYCNFHFSTSLKHKGALLEALHKEIKLTEDYLQGEVIDTIYFGGGTPSILAVDEIQSILEAISAVYTISDTPEITLEANPDDLTIAKTSALRNTPINRFSIGIQSFFEADLKYMNRAHDQQQAQDCIKIAQDAGFENLTIDLIYGTPTMSNEQWQQNITMAMQYEIPHLSCYCLTVEPKTALAHRIQKGKTFAVEEEQAIEQFEVLMQMAQQQGYEHYEISNFAKPNFYARHNSNYWRGAKYLGLGPSAHSYNGQHRRHNIANNALYIKAIMNGEIPCETEILSVEQQYNEYVMISLRTIWGTDTQRIKTFGQQYIAHFEKTIQSFLVEESVEQYDNIYRLTPKGKLIADYIAMELFV